MSALRIYLLDRLALDLRALALLRVALSLYVLIQLCVHGIVAPHVVGYLPVDLTAPWARVLAASAIIISLVAFATGYKTRWSAFSLWLTYALLHMGPEVDGYRALTCAVLLLCVFLPVGRYASFDDAMDRGALNDGAHIDRGAADGETRGGVPRGAEPWFGERSAVSFATGAALLFALGYVAIGIDWALELPLHSERWHVAAGFLIILMQLLPRSPELLRTAVIVLFVAAMIDQGLKVGIVAAVFERGLLVVLVTMLIPGSVFAWISESTRFSKRHELRIYYDEPCGFCRKICYIFASFLMLGRCRIATAQSDDVVLKILKDNDSWVVFDGDGQYEVCWAALLKLMRASPVWAPLGWLLTWIGMGVWGKPVYRLIGRSRNLLSKLTATVLPYSIYRLELRSWEKVVIVVWSLLMLAHYSGAGASLYGSVPDVLGIFGFDETR